jgi:hypothetical protein
MPIAEASKWLSSILPILKVCAPAPTGYWQDVNPST